MQEDQEGDDEEMEEAQDDDPDGDQQQPQPEENDPTTRKAFQLLKADYKGDTHLMVRDFLGDHMCHLKMRILVECGRPLQKEYDSALRNHKLGQHAMMCWQAERTDIRVWFPNWFVFPFQIFEITGKEYAVRLTKAPKSQFHLCFYLVAPKNGLVAGLWE